MNLHDYLCNKKSCTLNQGAAFYTLAVYLFNRNEFCYLLLLPFRLKFRPV